VTTLFLVRHGQASFGARNYDQLSANGERQGRLLGEHWRRCGRRFGAVYSGDMERQKVTAARALEALGEPLGQLRIDPAFNEFDHQSLIRAYLPLVAQENPQFAVSTQTLLGDPKLFQQLFNLIIACWISDREGASPVSESWQAFQTRCLAGVERLAALDEDAVAFTSGGVITAVLRAALDLDADRAFHLNWEIHNASVHCFKLGEERIRLLRFNEVAHLEVAREPGLLTYR
jgi:broad specificity phosphatase PhoE